MRHPRKGGRPNREGAGLRGVAAGVNARPTGGREVSGRGREGAAAGVRCPRKGGQPNREVGGRERPPYKWAGGKRPQPGERRLRGEGGRGMWVTVTGKARPQGAAKWPP